MNENEIEEEIKNVDFDSDSDDINSSLKTSDHLKIDTINLETDPQERKKSNLPPRRHISFHLIFNTNISKFSIEASDFEDLWNRMEKACEIFFKTKLINFIALSSAKNPGVLHDTPLEKRVEGRPKVEFIREIGPKRGLMHIHASVSFVVRAVNIKMNQPGIQNCMAKLLGLKNIHFCCKTYRLARETLSDYIRKTKFETDY
jgi:hypothetical protein